MILLSDEEIEVALAYYAGSDLEYPHTSSEYASGEHSAIAKAQVKKDADTIESMVADGWFLADIVKAMRKEGDRRW